MQQVDLQVRAKCAACLGTSAATGQGLDALKGALLEAAGMPALSQGKFLSPCYCCSVHSHADTLHGVDTLSQGATGYLS